MKQRRIYYRRKGSKIIVEGIKTLYGKRTKVNIKTLPDPSTLISEIDENGSFFKYKNKANTLQEIEGLDYGEPKPQRKRRKLRTLPIKRTSFEDPINKELWGMSK